MDSQTTAPQARADRAGTVGHETNQATKRVAGTAGQEAKRVTRDAKDQVLNLMDQTRSDLQGQAATQQSRAASGLRELSDQLRRMADGVDDDGMARGLVDDMAHRTRDAAGWLDSRDPASVLDEVRGFARRRPGAFLAIAAGVGVVAGRLSRGLIEEAREDSSQQATSGSSGTSVPGPTASQPTVGGDGTGTLSGSHSPTGGGGYPSGMPDAAIPPSSASAPLPPTPGTTTASGPGGTTPYTAGETDVAPGRGEP
jgi:hypothetical protein